MIKAYLQNLGMIVSVSAALLLAIGIGWGALELLVNFVLIPLEQHPILSILAVSLLFVFGLAAIFTAIDIRNLSKNL